LANWNLKALLLLGGRAIIPTGWDIRFPDSSFGECRPSEYLTSRRIKLINTYTTDGFTGSFEVLLQNDSDDDVTILEGAPIFTLTVLQYMSVDLAIVTGSFDMPMYEELPDSTQNH